MNIVVVADYAELSRRAAAFVAQRVRERPDMRIGLPTGNTPRGMYDELVRKFFRGEVDFSRVHTFNLDEYWGLAPDHPASFARYISECFLRHVNVAAENAHWPSGIGDAGENAAAYESLIADGDLDLVVLGIGANGHIGFNEPGSSFDGSTGVVPLAERTRQDAFHPAAGFASPEDVPTHGITMGIGTMMRSGSVLLLASGAGKAEAIAKAVEGPVTEAVPASVLQRHKDATIIVDEAAAGALTSRG